MSQGIPSVSVADVPERAEATLLDVREDDEWQQGHAPGAVCFYASVPAANGWRAAASFASTSLTAGSLPIARAIDSLVAW